MFSNKDEYAAATEQASINQYGKKSRRGYKLGIFNLFLLTTIGVMGYVSFDSLKNKSIFVKESVPLNTTSTNTSDRELLELLSSVNVKSVEDKKEQESLHSALNNLVSDSISSNDSLYTQALSRELDKETQERTIIVQKGDTLASLSLKYYGSALAYDKIISHNKILSNESQTIFPGQKLVLPY
jgi:LysM repeat protein